MPDGSRRLPEPWWRFHDFVQKTPDLPIGMLVRSGCAEPLPIGRGADRPLRERIAGAKGQPHAVVQGGGHFVQEDRGRALVELVVRWMRG